MGGSFAGRGLKESSAACGISGSSFGTNALTALVAMGRLLLDVHLSIGTKHRGSQAIALSTKGGKHWFKAVSSGVDLGRSTLHLSTFLPGRLAMDKDFKCKGARPCFTALQSERVTAIICTLLVESQHQQTLKTE